MGFCFSSPNKKDILKDSRELIEDNTRLLAVCNELAEGEFKEKTTRVYDAVRYMVPTTVVGAMQVDKKINALSGDLKIALSKGNDRGLLQAEDILKDISVAIAERNSYK